jgi:hypothetical protein
MEGEKNMRTYSEVKEKLDKYFLALDRTEDAEKTEAYCRIIDALLWVIEDESGAPI